ncbi:M24 family metallopeptidase [Paracoccus seriniphilus]|uniref:Xaa-Pro dipeptidase n=1 Tax=Paracoccus seriniphilus TaxID=184748 RepID=A0A239PZN7_9RHOB|nr:Xaa-Pro peptidase family protein [Paracoccus seriniphilus]WCR16318.1 aminopeptidase P family protein [Paracoccus seriniphilus]SNT75819.1 Xaa-Pro dipeptidase [Paracoccus seriniphilus]
MPISPAAPAATDLDRALATFHPVSVQPFAITAYRDRLTSLQGLIRNAGLAAVWLDASSSLTYFTGLKLGQSERIHGALICADGPPVYLTPVFEAPKLESLLRIPGPMLMWEEDEDPYALVARHLADLPGRGLALDPATPFRFASGMMSALEGQVASAGDHIAALRQVKSAVEIAIIQAAMDVSWQVQRAVHRGLRIGISTSEVGQFIDAAHRAAGLKPLFHAVQFGEATAYPHGVPHPQILQDGDMVLVDMGGTLQGYQSDITRSYVFGSPTARQRHLWHIEHAAHRAAFAAARPGAACEEVDAAARAVITKAGFGPGYQVPGLPHRTGHGLGLDIHEEPWIVKGNRTPLQPGMVFSIEPMLCVYGECGIRLEDIVYMTQDGPRWFSPPSPELDRPFG